MDIINGSGKETKQLEWTRNQGEGTWGERGKEQKHRGEEREE